MPCTITIVEVCDATAAEQGFAAGYPIKNTSQTVIFL
jgi:hypothetical protein